MSPKPYTIVVLISGSGSNLQAIIDEIACGKINARIAAVISNRPQAFGLERAKKAGIPSEIVDHTESASRENFDNKLQGLIDAYQPDLVVLAGFMRILTDAFVKHYRHRLINIHPSLLPKYRGLDTHKRALQDHQQEHGASVHFVIPELDAGTVIIQGVIPVKNNDTEQTLAKRVHQIEHIIYPQAIKWLADGNLYWKKNTILLNDKPLQKPVRMHLND